MKIIQTFWETEKSAQYRGEKENRHHGGWLSRKYHFMSWALSCLKFRQHYDEVELYTNAAGYKILIEDLRLPYTKVHLSHDDLDRVSPLLWAVPKIYTYSLQRSPFIHADGDVFIWEAFNRQFAESPLIAQHLENNLAFYEKPLAYINHNIQDLPDALSYKKTEKQELLSVNAGIFGGNEISFIREYTAIALSFIDENTDKLLRYEYPGALNAVIEQYLFYQLALSKGKNVSFLFDKVSTNFNEVMKFELVPHQQRFLHLVGTAKKDHLACSQVECFLKKEFPAYYESITGLFSPLQKKNPPAKTPAVSDQFKYTVDGINGLLIHYTNEHWDVQLISHKIKRIKELPFNNQTVLLLESMYKFEQVKVSFFLSARRSYDDNYNFECFCKAKEFLAHSDPQEILKQTYCLGSPYKVIEADFDLIAVAADKTYPENIIRTPERYLKGKYHILLTKKESGLLATKLAHDQLNLRLFMDQAKTGYDLAKIIALQAINNSGTLKDAEHSAVAMIAKALTFYGNLELFYP